MTIVMLNIALALVLDALAAVKVRMLDIRTVVGS